MSWSLPVQVMTMSACLITSDSFTQRNPSMLESKVESAITERFRTEGTFK